ncbi:ALQxL family class IV lanthipeptide [Kitasatospora sp. NBC_01560]
MELDLNALQQLPPAEAQASDGGGLDPYCTFSCAITCQATCGSSCALTF